MYFKPIKSVENTYYYHAVCERIVERKPPFTCKGFLIPFSCDMNGDFTRISFKCAKCNDVIHFFIKNHKVVVKSAHTSTKNGGNEI